MKTVAELDPRQKPLIRGVSRYLDDCEARAVERVLKSRIVCIKQPGYRRDREEKYRFDRSLFNGSTSGLGKHEAPAFDWMNFCRFRLIQTILESRGRTLGIRLARKIAKWSMEADATRNGIALANENLAFKAAGCTQPHYLTREDWNQEAVISLLRIIDSFDVGRGCRFSTLAFRSIIRELCQKRFREVRHNLGREDLSLINEPGAGPDITIRLLEAGLDVKVLMSENVARLSTREREVVRLRFGINRKRKTLKEVGKRFGISRERIRQIQRSAIEKLRSALS